MRPVSLARTFTALAALSAAVAARPAPLPAQSDSGVRWFPNRWVIAPLVAAPREIRLEGGLFSVDRDQSPDYDGSQRESEVALGYRIPVVRLLDGGANDVALDLGFEVGMWSRFNLETDERDLIATDYRVGFPISVRYRFLEGRLTFQHSSSHLGDDYMKRFRDWVYQVSREALELWIAVRPLESIRLYGGGDLSVGRGFDFAIEEGFDGQQFTTVEEWRLRFGAEYDPSWTNEGAIQPFAGANFETTDWTGRLASSVRGGVAFRVGSVRLLLDARFRDGPSAIGQFGLDPDGLTRPDQLEPFRGVDEQMIGLGLEVQLGGLVTPGPADRGL